MDDETLLSSVVRISCQMREDAINQVIRDRLHLEEDPKLDSALEPGDERWPEAQVKIGIWNNHTNHFATRDKLVYYCVEGVNDFWGATERGIL